MNEKNKKILEEIKKKKNDRLAIWGKIEDKWFVSTGINGLDHILGGGLPVGKVIEIYGPSGWGKTSFSMRCAKQFHDKWERIFFCDTEGTFPFNLQKTYWLENLEIYYPASGEDAVDQILEAIDLWYWLIILDSVGMMVPMSMNNDDVEASNVWAMGKLMTKFMRLVTDKLLERWATLICINHEKQKIGSMYGWTYTAWWAMLPYTASVRLRVSDWGKAWEKIKDGKIIYKTNKVSITKLKGKVLHQKEYEIYLDLKQRFCPEVDLVYWWISLGIIKQAWAYFKYWDISLWQGIINMKNYFNDNLDIRKRLLDQCRDMAAIMDKSDDLVFADDIEWYNKLIEWYNKKWWSSLEIYEKKIW